MWKPQCDALFDICVLDTDAKSYLDWSPVAVIKTAETERKRKYQKLVYLDMPALLPCISVDSLSGSEAECFPSCFVVALAEKWEKLYSLVMNWTRNWLLFAILHATLLCVHGYKVEVSWCVGWCLHSSTWMISNHHVHSWLI